MTLFFTSLDNKLWGKMRLSFKKWCFLIVVWSRISVNVSTILAKFCPLLYRNNNALWFCYLFSFLEIEYSNIAKTTAVNLKTKIKGKLLKFGLNFNYFNEKSQGNYVMIYFLWLICWLCCYKITDLLMANSTGIFEEISTFCNIL